MINGNVPLQREVYQELLVISGQLHFFGECLLALNVSGGPNLMIRHHFRDVNPKLVDAQGRLKNLHKPPRMVCMVMRADDVVQSSFPQAGQELEHDLSIARVPAVDQDVGFRAVLIVADQE
jgi:hypothetical protein